MRPAKLTCPQARYDDDMHIQCAKRGEPCAFQRWCNGKGWCVLTDGAADCPARRDENHVRKAETVKKRRNKV